MAKNPIVKKRKTYELRLTKLELVHIRDLFSVLLPPDASQTLSQALAALSGRPIVETMLWKKITDVCEAAELPIGEEAPDFIVAPTSPPPISVFQVASEPEADEDAGDEE